MSPCERIVFIDNWISWKNYNLRISVHERTRHGIMQLFRGHVFSIIEINASSKWWPPPARFTPYAQHMLLIRGLTFSILHARHDSCVMKGRWKYRHGSRCVYVRKLMYCFGNLTLEISREHTKSQWSLIWTGTTWNVLEMINCKTASLICTG